VRPFRICAGPSGKYVSCLGASAQPLMFNLMSSWSSTIRLPTSPNFNWEETMFKLSDKPTLYVDVDDTLVMWNAHEAAEGAAENDFLNLPSAGEIVTVFPHRPHINILRQFKARGQNVVVWSQGGSDWAETVVKALGIEHLVDAIVTKPNWFIDDIPATVFLPDSNRIWIDPKSERHSRIVRPANSSITKVTKSGFVLVDDV
jgi:hypothetical protein